MTLINIGTYIIFYFEVLFLNFIDYKIYKSIVTPFFFLSVPFTVVVTICLLFNKKFSFVLLYAPSIWIWILGLLLFWLAGQFCYILLKSTYSNSQYLGSVENNKIPLLVLLFCFCIACLKINSIDVSLIGSKELGAEVSIGGIMGRVSNMMLLFFPYVFLHNFKPVIKALIIGILFLFLVSMGSKTWLMCALLSSIICLVQNNKLKISLSTSLLVFVILGLAFFLYYALTSGNENIMELISFVARHFYFYLTSGTLAMSEYVRWDPAIDLGNFRLPFINILLIWLGIVKEGSGHSPLWFATDMIHGTESNVFTMFGQIYLGTDMLGYIFYCMFFGCWCYWIYIKSKRSSNIFIRIIDSYNLSLLFFAWFNCGFSILRIWEMSVYAFIFYIISKYKLSFRYNNEK